MAPVSSGRAEKEVSMEWEGDWIEAALANLEGRKAKLEAMIAAIRELQPQGSRVPVPPATWRIPRKQRENNT